LVIGLVLGAIAFYNAGDFVTVLAKVLGAGINLAAVMLLLPRMVSILMEGLIPISESAREFMQKRAGGDREFYIGLDSAILIGHPAAIASALVLVPIAILLSVILPGNRVILFADLAVIPFVVAMTAPVMRGNVLRIVIAGTITLAIGFYIATSMAPLFTSAAVASGFSLPEGAVQITSIADGFLWPPFLFVRTVQGLGALGLVVLLVLLAAAFFFFLRNTKAWEVAAGAPAEAPAAGD
jgi:PTS system galactitol-specific IIC component